MSLPSGAWASQPCSGSDVARREGVREKFTRSLGFSLDPFQARALDAIDDERSVLVAAPTGSGKTVVAEYAIAKALAQGGKAFYTTPLKALSNQKYADLCRAHDPERVGLLTGDNSINGEAPVVVMTTEVLRNMIYARSSTLAGLRYVILDEVHYLQNPYRGAVWEEVIIHSPQSAKLVCLSATVSNAEEFADWIETVRGATTAVIEERRPVTLNHLLVVGDRSGQEVRVLPTFVDGRPNPEGPALDAARPRSARYSGMRRRRFYTPRRHEVIDWMAEEGLLPAIYFIFSRAGCDDAVRIAMEQGVRLTTPEERRQVREIAESKVELLSDDDLSVLGYGRWLAGLEAGVAAHHAGLVPPFKEAVEACFASSLVKVVFATETLSLGINMPARTVVIERLSKFTGERHEPLTPGEYTQLTGRAGRRGIDDVGYGAVLWSPFVPFAAVVGLASTRSYELRSSFRPTYNMAANLVRRYSPERAHHLLNLSFAQYRTDAEVVRLESDLERLESARPRLEEAARCERGDIAEYRKLRAGASPQARSGASRGSARQDIRAGVERLRPGDVLRVRGAVTGDRLVVIATSRRRRGDVRVSAVGTTGRKLALSPADFAEPPVAAERIDLPVPYNPASTRFVRACATALRRVGLDDSSPGTRLTGSVAARERRRVAPGAAGPTEADDHPVAGCPDLGPHLKAARRLDRLDSDSERLKQRIKGHNESLARQFDRVLGLLREWGYVQGWELTLAGERLARIYHECDLLVARCLDSGLLDGLEPAALAALVSTLTYEPRGVAPGPEARLPGALLRRRWHELEALAESLAADETSAGLAPTRAPDPGFSRLAYEWADGRALEEVLADEEVSGGDFVRNVKQLLDLLRQIADVAPEPETAAAAREAAEAMFRGVVSASSVVGVDAEAFPEQVGDPRREPGERGRQAAVGVDAEAIVEGTGGASEGPD